MTKKARKNGDLYISTFSGLSRNRWFWVLCKYKSKKESDYLMRSYRDYKNRSIAIREGKKMFIHILNKQIEGMVL